VISLRFAEWNTRQRDVSVAGKVLWGTHGPRVSSMTAHSLRTLAQAVFRLSSVSWWYASSKQLKSKRAT